MTDTLRLLSTVAHYQAQEAGNDLKDIADKQKENISEKKAARDLSKLYDQITSDDMVTFDELVSLHEFRSELGTTDDAFWGSQTVAEFEIHEDGVNPWSYDAANVGIDEQHGNNSHFYLSLDNTAEDVAARRNQAQLDAIKAEIDGHKDDLEDNQSLLQFEIQMATSDMQNAESTRSQAEKRMGDHRKEMLRNWAG